MKKSIIIITLLLSNFIIAPAWADTDDFYFSDFTADYYLSKDDEGISHLRVVENLTAEFPNYAQNKGIVRKIPLSNQDRKNITLPNLDESDVTLLRNGVSEPIWSLSRSGDHYTLETGTDDYVLGTQVYTIGYEYQKVITDFSNHQELYWDTNGNGWPQKFDSVTARVHFADDLLDVYTGEKWCYVGKYGENNQTRCNITEIDDGFEFTVGRLNSYENLTFDIEIKPNSFVVPEPEISYALVVATVVFSIIAILIVGVYYANNRDAREKIKKYKDMIVAPQYQPHSTYDLVEMAEVYLGYKKDVKVGMILDMIVKKKILLRKKEETLSSGKKWEIVINDYDKLQPEEKTILRLLGASEDMKNGDAIELKAWRTETGLVSIGKAFDSLNLQKIKSDGLVSNKYKLGETGAVKFSDIKSMIAMRTIVVALFVWCFSLAFVIQTVSDLELGKGKYAVYESECNIALAIVVVVVVFMFLLLSHRKRVISNVTDEGLKTSNYMEGLRLYIKMAETDRLKFLQSVDGADISGSGVVKLYEKLLPYAAIFGLEESWMKEMKKYCEINGVVEPDYLLTGITAAELSRSVRTAASCASSSGHTIAGGGSYSSSSSGGGGGGFSGGGGGGGGGGGR